MKLITHQDILNLNISPLDWIEWAEHVLRIKNTCDMPPKLSINLNETGFLNTMPSSIPQDDVMGVKVVNRIVDRSPSLDSQLLLYRRSTGKCLAIMDANIITAFRTAAVAVNSIDLFALPDFSTVGILGLGIIGVATLDLLFAKFPNRKIDIKLLRYKNEESRVMRRFANKKLLSFKPVDSLFDLVSGSDVVISAIPFAATDLTEVSWFKPGSTLVPIHTRGFQNCDSTFDKVFGDDYGQVSHFKFFDRFKSFSEVGQVLRGERPGRESPQERILCYNVGISLQDVYAALKIYEKCEKTAKEIDLEAPKSQFWLE